VKHSIKKHPAEGNAAGSPAKQLAYQPVKLAAIEEKEFPRFDRPDGNEPKRFKKEQTVVPQVT